ncbi:amidohydrolase family protein [uncultured Enterovirga sp.]|uniref:amidohydrolase family protein n=1 Tax=uncultured Enterovirga sp. TaxID=2026352 RepID=UPI0035C96E3F
MIDQALVLDRADAIARVQSIVIDGDRIVAIGSAIDRDASAVDHVVDGRGKLVTPGFINAHYHSHDRLDRGRFGPMPLEIWMGLYNPPTVDRGWTADEVYLRTLMGGIELLRGGATSVIDDVHLGRGLDEARADAVFRAYRDIGLRADVGIAFSDKPFQDSVPFLDEILPQELKAKPGSGMDPTDMLSLWRGLIEAWSGRVRAVVSVSGPQRCTDDFQQRAWTLARDHGRTVLTHVLETRVQALSAEMLYGRTMVEHLREIGILDRHLILMHGIWTTERDLDLVAAAEARVVHNPGCNLKLGSGVAPVARMMARGIDVGIGTDNHSGNDGCSMFECVKLATMLQSLITPDHRDWLGAADGLQLGIQGGAACMGKAELGALKVGSVADFLVFDLSDDAFTPLNDAANHLVFCNPSRALSDVYVNGYRVMADRRLTSIDEDEVRREIAGRIAVMHGKILAGSAAGTALQPYLAAAFDRCSSDPRLSRLTARCACWTGLSGGSLSLRSSPA